MRVADAVAVGAEFVAAWVFDDAISGSSADVVFTSDVVVVGAGPSRADVEVDLCMTEA